MIGIIRRVKSLEERLQEIETQAVNFNGYYVLDEKEKYTIFCSGGIYEKLATYLHKNHGSFNGGSTYFQRMPEHKKYGFHLTINKTAKKTVKHLQDFLNKGE